MRRRLACERGLALVSAVVLMTLMTGVGLTAFAYVDVQQRESAVERMRESAFNLSEGALSGETFLLARKWPDAPSEAFPANCASTGVLDPQRCPDPDFLARSFGTADYASGSSWIVSVRDNGGDLAETAKVEQDSGSFYDPGDDDKIGGGRGDDPANQADDADDTATDAQPSWDYNRDGRMWIRAQATVRTKRRTLVALVDVDELVEAFPTNAITAGQLTTGGNKHLAVKTNGSLVAIRNIPAPRPEKWQTQIEGGQGAVEKLTDGGKALSDRALDRLRQRAAAQTPPTYYPSGCPSSLEGDIVFIESSGGSLCQYTGNASFNCPSYGVVVVADGGLSLGGTVRFCGVVYLANTSGSQGTLFDIFGNASVTGTVAVDGLGGINVGNSSKPHLTYDPKAAGAVRSYPSGAIVPSTWREIQG